tara:strand:+ start:284 stop:889 length:606 start_codon:yes stop_codon:yes gene_type:complete
MTIPTEDLQKTSPAAKIELFELKLVQNIHYTGTTYPSGSDQGVFRFHNGINMNTSVNIIFNTKSYLRIPIEATGFEKQSSNKSTPRPTLRLSNAFSSITSIMQQVNLITPRNDLSLAKFTRKTTLVKYLDATNFDSSSPEIAVTSPPQLYPDEIYFIERKVQETQDLVEFELRSALDFGNKRIPSRIVTRKDFPTVGGFAI